MAVNRFVIWLAPAFLFCLAAGAVWEKRAGTSGDYFGYVLVIRLHLENPGGVPLVLPKFDFPRGEPKTDIPEAFSEPVSFGFLALIARVVGDPVRGMWVALLVLAAGNLFGTFWYFWRRYSRESLAAVFTGWFVIASVPWWWARAIGHWHLAWMPPLLFAIGLWADFFARGVIPSRRWLWVVPVLHFILLGQSVYYGSFVLILLGYWSAAYSRRLVRDRAFRRGWITLIALMGIGYAADVAWVIQGYGGVAGARQVLKNGKHEEWKAYVYSNRLRELIRGAPGSPADRIASKLLMPKTRGLDSEGFPAPLPKILILLATAFFIFKRRSFKLDPRCRAFAAFCGVTLLAVLLTGMQEVNFVRAHLIYKFFPFLGSYARMFIVLIMALGLGFAEFARVAEKSLPSRVLGLCLAYVIAALWIDYGFDWRHEVLARELPCPHIYSAIRERGLPTLISVGEGDGSCRASLMDVYAITGMPVLQKFTEGNLHHLADGNVACAQARARVQAVGGPVTWWYSGSLRDFKEAESCFPRARLLLEEPGPDGSPNRLLEIF